MKYKNFTQCNEEELRTILRWRNKPSVRKASLSNEIISEQSHFLFVKNLKQMGEKGDKLYFLVFDNKNPVGVISFVNINTSSAEIGYYKNPDLTSKGIGKILINFAFDFAKNNLRINTISSKVLETNISSIKIMLDMGFEKSNNNKYIKRNGEKIKIILFEKQI